MSSTSSGNASDLGLTFEYTYETLDGPKTVDMKPDAEDLTNENLESYIEHYVRFASYELIQPYFDAFQRGWRRLMPDYITRMFSASELMKVVQGADLEDISVDDLRSATFYDDGYSPAHQVIIWFWEIVHGFDAENKRKLLEFITASDRVPVVGGLSSVTIIIQRNGPDSDRLPTSLTCFGRLLLPEYGSKEKLERMLLTSIQHSKGFGLV